MGSGKARNSQQLLDGQGDGHVRERQSDMASLVPRGKLVTVLQSGLMFDEVKRHTGPNGVSLDVPTEEVNSCDINTDANWSHPLSTNPYRISSSATLLSAC